MKKNMVSLEGDPSSRWRAPQDDKTLLSTDTSPLPEMSPIEETLADYETMDLTTGPHLISHMRSSLRAQGVLSASELDQVPNGRRVRAGGAIIVRQRPGTAKGFVFVTLEDETGMTQAIIRPDLFKENRSLIVRSPGLIIEGILQRSPGQPSIRAEKIWAIDSDADVRSHDFH